MGPSMIRDLGAKPRVYQDECGLVHLFTGIMDLILLSRRLILGLERMQYPKREAYHSLLRFDLYLDRECSKLSYQSLQLKLMSTSML
jgi:hypothetical protein